jgi:protease I
LIDVPTLSTNPKDLSMKVLILTADGFEDLELFYLWYRLQEENVQVTVSTPKGQTATGLHGYCVEPDSPIGELNPSEYDLLYIPGGQAPERLRLREEAVAIARTFMDDGRRLATAGKGAQMLISAGVLHGRQVTCSPAIGDDVRAAGAQYRDESVVVDDNLITCRGREEMAEFCRQIIAFLGVRT